MGLVLYDTDCDGLGSGNTPGARLACAPAAQGLASEPHSRLGRRPRPTPIDQNPWQEILVAEAFAEAEREDAVLILDEVDTFLYGRDSAIHS